MIASCTARPPITLFISKKNVLSIYSESKKGEPEVKTLNVVSETELRKNCVDWLTQMGVNMSSSAKSPATRSMSIPSSSVSSDSNSSGQSSNVNFEWNPDKILTDLDFDVNDFAESIEPPLKTFNFRENSNPESFACKRAKFDVSPEKSEPEKENDSKFSQSQSSPRRVGTQVQDLSPSEKLMVQEVLNGINFDDFEN